MLLAYRKRHVLVHETELERSDASLKGMDDRQGTRKVVITNLFSVSHLESLEYSYYSRLPSNREFEFNCAFYYIKHFEYGIKNQGGLSRISFTWGKLSFL